METITINGLEWNIEEVEEIAIVVADRHILGSTYSNTLHIVILKDLPPTNFKKVLIHELTHAFIYSFGLDQVKKNDEVLCDFVSAYSEQILKVANDYLEKRKP